MNLDRLIQLSTGMKTLKADHLSNFDYSTVISSESFAFKVLENGTMMNAHIQLRIIHVNKVVSSLELVYVPIEVGAVYYELGNLREERTIRNLALLLEELGKNDFFFDDQERYWC